MRFGAALLMAAVSTGCVHRSQGTLISTQAGVQSVQAPVVCGPIGFRKTPLQARWGEYVKVTVTAQTALRGTVLVHAAGVAQEPQTFVADGAGAVVVDARFPNEDPDRRFALERERPIDITLTTLEGTCEGAVFTVEQGALVPDVTDQAWIAELERRGGPELAARREAARREADARREAHYADWASRRVEVSAEVLVQREAIRQAHYAAVDARHTANSLSLQSGERVGERGSTEIAVSAANEWSAPPAVAGSQQEASGSVSAVAVIAADEWSAPPAVTGSMQEASGSVSAVAVIAADEWSAPPAVASSQQAASGSVSAAAIATVEVAAPPVQVEATSSRPEVAAAVVVSAPAEWHSYDAALSVNAQAWAPPPAPAADWVQPSQPSLQPVAVSSEASVPCPPGMEPVAHVEQVEVVAMPGVIDLLLNVAAGLTVSAGQQVHGAQPVSR